MSRLGVTAHGGPCGPLQFDRLGSRLWPPHPLLFERPTKLLKPVLSQDGKLLDRFGTTSSTVIRINRV